VVQLNTYDFQWNRRVLKHIRNKIKSLYARDLVTHSVEFIETTDSEYIVITPVGTVGHTLHSRPLLQIEDEKQMNE